MTTNMKNPIAECAPVVALHASASSGRQWNALKENLLYRHNVITPNLPGYGTDINTGMGDIANGLIRMIEALGEPVHLIGHSFGGAVALKVALENPGVVKSMTLFEPAVFHLLGQSNRSDAIFLDEILNLKRQLLSYIAAGQPALGMKSLVDFWSGSNAFENLSLSQRDLHGSMVNSALNDMNNCLAETWASETLNQLRMPVQILMGMESPNFAQRTATKVFEGINHAEFVMLPSLDHMAPINASNWVNPRIQQHIARVERSADRFCWPQRQAA